MPSVAVSYDNYRGAYTPFSADLFVNVGDAVNATLAAARIGHTIFVRHMIIVVHTTAAVTFTVRDNAAGTPKVLAHLPNSTPVGVYTYDFGQEGIGVTEAQALLAVAGAAGYELTLHAEGYYRQTGVLTPAQLASA